MKKQHSFWLSDLDYKKLMQKVEEQFTGKGKLERFMERIANDTIIFIKGSGRFKITTET